jgi:hypothetical protein
MRALAAEQRFEEAADVRERAAALARALRRQRQIDALVDSGRLVIEIGPDTRAELHDGRLVRAWSTEEPELSLSEARPEGDTVTAPRPSGRRAQLRLVADPGWSSPHTTKAPLPLELADELVCVAAWLDDQAGRIRVVDAEHGLASALPRLPSFEPRTPGLRPRRQR